MPPKYNKTFRIQNLPDLSIAQVKEAFGKDDLIIINSTEELKTYLEQTSWSGKNLLFMSSGNYGGINVDEYAKELLGN